MRPHTADQLIGQMGNLIIRADRAIEQVERLKNGHLLGQSEEAALIALVQQAQYLVRTSQQIDDLARLEGKPPSGIDRYQHGAPHTA